MRLPTRRQSRVIGEVPSKLAGRFDVSDLAGQYRLSRTSLPAPPGWLRQEIRGWQLIHEPSLPALPIIAENTPVGWMLGHPVGPDGRLIRDRIVWPAVGNQPDYRRIEEDIYSHAGRYVALLLFPSGPRVYLDPMGSIGVQFCPMQKIVSSSPFLIPYTADTRDRGDLIEAISAPGSHLFVPFGLTPRHGIDWLLPNHYLDLTDWTTHRHWPDDAIDPSGDPRPLVDRIVSALEKNLAAVIQEGPVQMSLTAGRDSRTLLAVAREYISSITFVTLSLPDPIGRTDRNVAPRIARAMNLRHRMLRHRRASPVDMERYAYRTGCMVRDPRAQRAVRTMGQLNPEEPYVMGLGGEVGRANHWRADDHPTAQLSPEQYLMRRNIPPLAEIVRRGRHWFDHLPSTNTLTVLNLLEIELETGGYDSWYAFGFPGAGRFHFHPFNDRTIFDAMLRLPPAYAREQRLTDDIVALRWPELAKFPYNEPGFGPYGFYRRARRRVRRVVGRTR